MFIMHHNPAIAAAVTILSLLYGATGCPRQCRCDSRSTVYCIEKNLDTVPYGIPIATTTLHLQRNQVTNSPTTNEILSSLKNLVNLDLHQNSLTSVPQGLPNTLQVVSFRSNRIKYVGRSSLKGMASLTELHLDENNITNQGISPSAFWDTESLEELILSNNKLTALPEGLPSSLRVLRLDNNEINVITRRSIEKLTNLINLDLSQNAISQRKIAAGAMISLTSLQVLDMSRNQLTEVPTGLPDNLLELMLSNNNVEYIYDSENESHGSLRRLGRLGRLDLSSNNLKSVQASSFANLNLHSVELQDNPWQCDCNLRYFKRWLSSTSSALSSESSICCHTPSAFSGVTLNSIDEEALNCDARINTREMMKIVDVESNGFSLVWSGNRETPDPPFVDRSLIFGPMKCQNCSLESSPTESQALSGKVTSHMENYSLQDITMAVFANPTNATVSIDRLQPDTLYAVCILDSQQDASTITISQCMDVRTRVVLATSTPHEDSNGFIPLWLIILCCVLGMLFVLIIIITVAVCKRRFSMKSKTPRTYSNRDDLYYPDAYLPGFTRPVAYTAQPTRPGYGTHLTDRTYAECGPGTAQRTIGDSAVDARMEFELLMQPNDATSPKRLHTPISSCSDYREDSTMSTSQTGRSSANGQTASPPPTYDSLHSYTSMGQRSSLANGTITPRLGHEPGSYV